ncbi:hypothetical protein L6452_06157 [Arctium lappa]|uniref:Uncharacterized protein n=1 Tax=Arctium lappa TaxID=4217 RepID=A0ACB9EIM9_ARCLA|nr:hypothetical protein L6452_06157 [Arctium lappa]
MACVCVCVKQSRKANGSDMGQCGVNVDSDCSPKVAHMNRRMWSRCCLGVKELVSRVISRNLIGLLVLEHQRRSCRTLLPLSNLHPNPHEQILHQGGMLLFFSKSIENILVW